MKNLKQKKSYIKKILLRLRILGQVKFAKGVASYLFFSFLATFLYFALTLIKLTKKKRIVFCQIYANRLGHLIINTEIFFRRRQNGYYPKDNYYIGFCRYFPISNHCLLKMLRRYLCIVESRVLECILSQSFFGNTQYYFIPSFEINEFYELNELKPVFRLTEQEIELGRKQLLELGIRDDDWFVCFHARDNTYLNNAIGPRFHYHNYRDCDIENYLAAAEYIVSKGGYAIRMGSIVEKPLSQNLHPKIIDYASKHRSEFMDIFLSMNCKFFLGNTSGLQILATLAEIPVANANWTFFDHAPLCKGDLYIPKKMLDVKENRQLSFKEMKQRGAIFFCDTEQFKKAGIAVVENSSDEILELAKEMNMRIDGDYLVKSEDEELQKNFRTLIEPSYKSYDSPARVGSYFLRKNKALLEN